MTETRRRLRVFLCHSSQDKPIVRELYRRLLAEGWIDPWLDEEKLLPGQDWDLEIEKAAEAADVVIVCLSANSVNKEGYVQRELRFVLDIALTKPDETIFVIPLRLEDCQPPRRLRGWQYADYFPPERRQWSYQRLQQSLKIRLEQRVLRDTKNVIRAKEEMADFKEVFPSKEILPNKNTQNVTGKEPIAHSAAGTPMASPASSVYKLSTICVETAGGVSTPIYYKGDPVPFKKSVVFSTAEDNQKKVEVHLLLGENRMARDNVSLGKYVLDGIPPASKGVPQIQIQFELDKDLNLSITATEKSTGRVKYLGDISLTDYSSPPVKDPLPPVSHNSSVEGLSNKGDFNWNDWIRQEGSGQDVGGNAEDAFAGGGFSDFFKAIFGETMHSSARNQAVKQQYERRVDITFQEACEGTERMLQVNDRKLTVRIPAGVKTGSKIRLAGAGPEGLDLFLVVEVQPHPFFTRIDSDLYMRYPISEELAFYGGELQVPVIERGKSMYIAIPPNTKDKQVFKFASRGIVNLKDATEHGDFYLTIDTYDPQNVPPRFQRVLEIINDHMK